MHRALKRGDRAYKHENHCPNIAYTRTVQVCNVEENLAKGTLSIMRRASGYKDIIVSL